MKLLLERLFLLQFLPLAPHLSNLGLVLLPFPQLRTLLLADLHQLEGEARSDEHTQQ